MNPNYLPEIGQSLRRLAEFATWREVNDDTLTQVAAELDRARAAVAAARGVQRANRCLRHLGGPVDPTATNGCLLCGQAERQPAPPVPEEVVPGDVIRFYEQHGHQAAADQFGGRALARALALQAHPANPRPGLPAEPPTTEGDATR
ncbi:hypothetical protein [Actinacidiphila sp. ITFR-21]|uniref:hypothetical protein n=1 Tax=Actinacidiphila sp. ITFR-21 TaxID=3075199 RepID=UPI00288B1613|nr:hypothetical protein [Streptomyces sp. ITFR-21]WNI20336.1 hypothetical protein RLT57_32550 [Streptomyces sp. ITFR-21]